MSKKLKIALLLTLAFIVSLFGIKFYLDKNYLNQFEKKQIVGEDRFDTMVKISEKGWKHSEEALLVSIHSVIDGISVSSFAYKKDIPIFFTDTDELNGTIKDELKRLGVKKVYLTGGKKEISRKVEKELSSMNIKNERIAGKDGFETSIKLAEKVNDISPITEVALVNMKKGKPNGVALAPAAARRNMPIIMVNKSDRKETLEFIQKHNIKKVYLIGDEVSFPKAFEEMLKTKVVRINGEDRHDTNKEIIKEFYSVDKLKNIYILRNGIYNYADFLNALSLSPIAARENTPILYSGDSLGENEIQFLEKNNIKKITEVGFELTRPKIITDEMVKFISSISIIVIWMLALKRILYKS